MEYIKITGANPQHSLTSKREGKGFWVNVTGMDRNNRFDSEEYLNLPWGLTDNDGKQYLQVEPTAELLDFIRKVEADIHQKATTEGVCDKDWCSCIKKDGLVKVNLGKDIEMMDFRKDAKVRLGFTYKSVWIYNKLMGISIVADNVLTQKADPPKLYNFA